MAKLLSVSSKGSGVASCDAVMIHKPSDGISMASTPSPARGGDFTTMHGKIALIVHPQATTLAAVSEALVDAGLKVIAARSDDEAASRMGGFFVPDVVLTTLGTGPAGGSESLTRLRANPLTKNVPMIILASGEPDERRRGLRLGVTLFVPPPHDAEEVVLTARLVLDRHRDESLLSGSLEQLPVPDLLQTIEATRRSGVISLRSLGRHGTLWFRGGRVIDAEVGDGRRGKEAVFAIALWQEGTFEADFSSISVPERISESTSFLLLEAMRRSDEASQGLDSPPHAALPDPPPRPSKSLLAIHLSVTLLNVAAAYAENHLESSLLRRRLERLRAELVAAHPVLADFAVGSGGRAVWTGGGEAAVVVESLVRAVARWVTTFFDELERALPGRFSIHRLKTLTEALQEDLEALGFYAALEVSTSSGEDVS